MVQASKCMFSLGYLKLELNAFLPFFIFLQLGTKVVVINKMIRLQGNRLDETGQSK